MKRITLMALCSMLRPSDIAPKAKCVKEGKTVSLLLTADRIEFQDDGSTAIYLHGIKKDYDRDGFRVYLMPCSVSKVCPVLALQELVSRSEKLNPAWETDQCSPH